MNHTAKETESGAIREIESEIRTLFTKVVERDPREAAYHAVVAKSQISTSLASGKFILWIACRACSRIFSGNDQPRYCAFTDVGCLLVFLGLAALLI
jgi:hypothetical protein